VCNDAIFQRAVPTVEKAKCVFKNEFAMVFHREKRDFPLISSWLESRL
jgi:hypothetical protein